LIKHYHDDVYVDEIASYFNTPMPSQTKRVCINEDSVININPGSSSTTSSLMASGGAKSSKGQLGFVFSNDKSYLQFSTQSGLSSHSGLSFFRQPTHFLEACDSINKSRATSSFDPKTLFKCPPRQSSHFHSPLDQELEEESHRAGKRSKAIVPFESFELEDKVSGAIHDFRLYRDEDLPFLNSRTEQSAMIRKNIIQGSVDDDCQTDDEQKEDAKRMLRDEIK
jgi:hypothetical protein